jgi:hypothetical protein
MYARPGLECTVASSRTTPPAKAKRYVETSRARPFPTSKEARPQRTKASHYNSNTTPSPHPRPHHKQQSFYASPAIVAGFITYHQQLVRLYPLPSPTHPSATAAAAVTALSVWLLQTLSPRAPHRSHGGRPTAKSILFSHGEARTSSRLVDMCDKSAGACNTSGQMPRRFAVAL